jgi:hypothetical protein
VLAGCDPAVLHPDEHDDTPVGVVLGVEDEGLEGSFRISGRRRKLVNDGLQELVDSRAELRRDGNGLERVEPEVGIDLLPDPVDVSRRKIDLVDDREECEVVLHGHVEVRERLGFDPLGRVDEDEGAVAGHERAPHLVGEVHVSRGVDEVELILLSVLGVVQQADGVALDGDPSLPFDIHGVEDLIAELAVGDGPALLDEPVGEGRLPVIDVGDDAEIANELGRHMGLEQMAS